MVHPSILVQQACLHILALTHAVCAHCLDLYLALQRLKVLRPLSEPDTFCTTLWRPVKGVLFYGPPGTGGSCARSFDATQYEHSAQHSPTHIWMLAVILSQARR
jgi:hypothetical protein